MNGIEKILAHIKSESAAECETITKGAAEQCELISAQYAKAEQDEYWKVFNAGTKEAERRLERLNSLAALESKKLVLATQQEMIAEAFELAAKTLLELPEREYITFLAKLAFGASLTGSETIYLSQSDHKRVGNEVLNAANSALRAAGKTASLSLSDKTVNIRGGLILSGGDIEVNCGVDALVDQYRNELSPRIAAELFS